MQTNTNSTESKTDSTTTPPATTIPKPPGVVETPVTNKDEFGYEKEKAVVVVEEPVKEVVKDEPVVETDEQKVKLEIDEALKELPQDFDKEVVSKFAIENKLSKEQVEAYAKFAAADLADKQAKQEEHVKTTRAGWEKELKEDPEFGGENFDLNVDRAEKVLEKYLVNTKKELTERGTMLPPYIMRDLYALSKVLNPKEPLVVGETGEVTDKRSHLDILYK